MIEKTTMLVFHANTCVNLRMSEIENRHSTFPMYAHIQKKFYFQHFSCLVIPSKAVLMQTQQKDGQLQNSPTLSSSPPSHYLIRYCGYAINFLSLAVLFNSLLLVYYVPAIKALQYEHIDSGVNDSEYHGKPICFCRALSMNKI